MPILQTESNRELLPINLKDIHMKKIVNTNPENTKNYLKPTDKKVLLIVVCIKLALAAAGTAAMPVGQYSPLSTLLLRLLMFSFIYDICCFYQVCLQIAQSYLISLLLFIVLLSGGVFLFNRFFSFLAVINPATEAGQNLSMIIMILIFLIPLLIDAVRLIKRFVSSENN